MDGGVSQTKLLTKKKEWLGGRLVLEEADPSGQGAACRGFYPSGKPNFYYPMEDGLNHGICQTWYEDGTLEGEEIYLHGKLHGLRRQWWPNGKPMKFAEYRNGKHHGPTRFFYPTGALESSIYTQNEPTHCIVKKWDPLRNIFNHNLYIHSVWVPEDLTKMIFEDRLDARTILGIKNSETRRVCLGIMGYSKFLAEMSHEVLETRGEEALIRIDWHPKEEPIVLVRVQCPSTGAFYTLRVPPQVKTIKEAVAWTFETTEENYHPESEA